MNIIFMRHGEATDNVKGILSDKEIYWSVLTEAGEKTARETADSLDYNIDKAYVSPLPRTIQTAHIVAEKFNNVEFVIDNRLREIQYGKYSGQQNNTELDNTRIKQINGDYFVRFGDTGDNKYDIEKRLSDFLQDVVKNNAVGSTILIVSHGSITSYMKRILNLKSPHLSTGKAEVFFNVDFSHLFEKVRELEEINKLSC